MTEFFVMDQPMGESIQCDYCSSTENLVASYPARDTELDRLKNPATGGTVVMNSRGWWCACEPCHELIQRGDRDGLAQRSIERFEQTHGRAIPTELLAESIRLVHDQFWANREGAPYKLDIQKIPFTNPNELVPTEVWCWDCRQERGREDVFANFNAGGPCTGCGRPLGYTEDDRLG